MEDKQSDWVFNCTTNETWSLTGKKSAIKMKISVQAGKDKRYLSAYGMII
jgi:hypothetical protein